MYGATVHAVLLTEIAYSDGGKYCTVTYGRTT